jgi:hypothetical protein
MPLHERLDDPQGGERNATESDDGPRSSSLHTICESPNSLCAGLNYCVRVCFEIICGSGIICCKKKQGSHPPLLMASGDATTTMKAIINNLTLLQLLFLLCIVSSSFSAAVAGGGGGGGVLRKFAAENDDPGVLNVHVVPHTHDDGRKKMTTMKTRRDPPLGFFHGVVDGPHLPSMISHANAHSCCVFATFLRATSCHLCLDVIERE